MSFRPSWAEIDLGAIRGNCAAVRSLLAPGVAHLAVVKADAYGHGDVPVARACLEAGVDRLGVALVEEAVRLRAAGIDAPILVLFEPPAGAARTIVEHEIVTTVNSAAGAEALSHAACAANTRTRVHVAVDTGMHREGVPADDALELVRHVTRLPGLVLEGVWSHLAAADEQDHPSAAIQTAAFAEVCGRLAADGIDVPVRHLALSAAILALPETHMEMVRAGLITYGLYPSGWLRDRIELRPAMRLVSRVAQVRRVAAGEGVSYGLTWAPDRETTVATIPVGYADGYPRALSGRADVLVHGRRRRVAGRVTMDQIMVDCGDDAVTPGDEVVLMGAQRGPDGSADEVTADELAGLAGTISYEIVTRIGPRVPRVYR